MALSEQTKTYLKVAVASPDAATDLVNHVDSIETSQIDAGAITSAKMDQNLIRYADVTIAHAAILTLGTVPVTLVAAPGSGYFIDPISVIAYYNYDTAAYTLTTETVDVQYGSGATVLAALLTNGEFIGTADVRKNMRQAVANLAPVDNSKLQLTTSGGTDPGDGNAAASLKVRVYYRIVPYSL